MDFGRMALAGIGGALKGYGEGVQLDGKQRRDMALKLLEEEGADRRTKMQVDNQTALAGIREAGDDRRSAATIQGQKDIAGMREAGDNTRAATEQASRKAVAELAYSKFSEDEEGNMIRVSPDGKATIVTDAKGSPVKAPDDVKKINAITSAVKASTDPVSGETNWDKVTEALDLAGVKVDKDKIAGFKKMMETTPAEETDKPGFWSKVGDFFKSSGPSYKTPEDVGDAFRKGKITRMEADKILRDQFGGVD